MEVRCGQCNKLFRVSDDKITGTGVKFPCTKCGGDVKITIEAFREYQLSKDAVSVLDTFAPKPSGTPPVPPPEAAEPAASSGNAGFDIVEDHRETGKQASPLPEVPPFLVTRQESPAAAGKEVPSPITAKTQPAATAEEKPKQAPLSVTAVKPAAAPASPKTVPAPRIPQAKDRPSDAARPVASMPPPPPPPSPVFTATTVDAIHPLVSGSLAGTVGGIGCAVPVLIMTILGVGAVSVLAGKMGGLPLGQVILLTGSSFIGFGVLIGIILAFFQTRTAGSMFGFLGILLGGFLGAVFGAIQGVIVAAGSGAVFSTAIIVTSALRWGIKALLLAGAVVLARRTMLSSRTESSGATITGGQLFGVALAVLVLVLGVIGEVRTTANMKNVKDEATKAFQEMASPEGLQVTSSMASWDQTTGDLVLNVTIENTGDSEKKAWYLVSEVNDASGNILATAKMLSGKQLYSQRDYEIMGRRGVNIQVFRAEQMKQEDTPVPPHAVINVEMRVMEPPQGVASFVASFRPFDPLKILQEQMEEAAQRQGAAGTQRTH